MGRFLGALAFVGVLICSTAWAHQDRIFSIAKDGSIAGIDKKFGPVSIKVQPAQGKRAAAVLVRFGKNENRLPPCLAKLFVLPHGQEIRVLGSWWHVRSSLPPYLQFQLPQTHSAAKASFEGHSVLFDLSTAEILEVSKRTSKASSFRSVAVDLKTICSKTELKGLRYKPLKPAKKP